MTVAVEQFALDGAEPAQHIRVESEAQVVDALRAANADRRAVVIWGGGTRIDIGAPLERYDWALDLRGLDSVVAHEPADMTITVDAGMTIADLQRIAGEHRQWWPVEVAHPERATVGGTIASAVAGASRLRYLHPRDWLIGVRAVLGDGTATKAGGRVVKNATGYDLARMYSGTFGTLAAITEVSLKLTPLPERRVTLRADVPDLGYAYTRSRDLLRERPPLDAFAVTTGERSSLGSPTWTSIFVRLAGNDASVERLRAVVQRALGPTEETGDDVWQRIADLPADATMTLRGSWPAGEPVEVYPREAVWYPGVEILFVLDEIEAGEIRELRHAAEAATGALVIERAPLALKRDVGVWGTPRVPGEIAHRVRERLDPNGVLAPGRMP